MGWPSILNINHFEIGACLSSKMIFFGFRRSRWDAKFSHFYPLKMTFGNRMFHWKSLTHVRRILLDFYLQSSRLTYNDVAGRWHRLIRALFGGWKMVWSLYCLLKYVCLCLMLWIWLGDWSSVESFVSFGFDVARQKYRGSLSDRRNMGHRWHLNPLTRWFLARTGSSQRCSCLEIKTNFISVPVSLRFDYW